MFSTEVIQISYFHTLFYMYRPTHIFWWSMQTILERYANILPLKRPSGITYKQKYFFFFNSPLLLFYFKFKIKIY